MMLKDNKARLEFMAALLSSHNEWLFFS